MAGSGSWQNADRFRRGGERSLRSRSRLSHPDWDGTVWVDQAKGDRLGERKEITFASVATAKVRLLIGGGRQRQRLHRGMDDTRRRRAQPLRARALGVPPQCKGRQGLFLPSPGVAALKAVLTEALPDGDVVIEQDRTLRAATFPTFTR